ncbi:helix-turn-helix domain-containing protein [Microbispora rosea]|uniref:helix-turn-helix domain-containing protein n=1 Tax=Microbispora rosea TaxID=58117 RepID=UPI0037BB8193
MPVIPKNARVTGPERDRLAADLKKSYEAGATIRDLIRDTGRSYGFIHDVLVQAGATLRKRGGDTRSKAARSRRRASAR